MYYPTAKILKHSITLEYTCPETKEKSIHTELMPTIGDGQYYEDYHYTYIEIKKCRCCGKKHKLEI